ncbi:class I SAM-dependent methyltransferase [Streptomyces sp. WMMB303]|uniref:class I SAM-dependent methyltransferase n=1 Tax=Streptomyces sp. WMMB303 TaxID=3034154 RepID=UPI0023EDC178|nr:class I SAM-dependent methyltransferase [Streptomyces sp. WMMB303]MDF4249620.1 class I SAM-dependent methyltransferase [Streptomyces sp. WMMB303]
MTLLRAEALSTAFDHAAASYDRLVAANPGYHTHLRRSARRLVPAHEGRGLRLLDLGCGTGASTAALVRAAPQARIVAVDASAGMLARARAKSWSGRVSFVHAPAEQLAGAGVTGPFDAVFAAYLFRNVGDPDALLRAVHRLLAPGGRLGVHEYTLSGRTAHRAVWRLVSCGLVRPAGTLCGDRSLYRHLADSVAAFDTAEQFARRMARQGFTGVRTLPVPGWQTGIVHTFLASAGPVRAEARRGAAR